MSLAFEQREFSIDIDFCAIETATKSMLNYHELNLILARFIGKQKRLREEMNGNGSSQYVSNEEKNK